jgi:predicted PhzF superfamily epimerase YddE/YHI9
VSREHRFVQVDVFTDRIFGGNPLAVVLNFVHIRLRAAEGHASDIRVGGGVVPVLEGRLCLP